MLCGYLGGFLSAVLGRGEIIDLDPAYTSTHGGHPLACVSGLTTIEIIEEENLFNKALIKEKLWKKFFPGKKNILN